MDNTIHIDVEVVSFETGGVGTSGVEGEADGSRGRGEVDSIFEDILDYLWVLFREPAVEGWDSHG